MVVRTCQEHTNNCAVVYTGDKCPVCALIEDMQDTIDSLYDPEQDPGSEQADRKNLESWERAADETKGGKNGNDR